MKFNSGFKGLKCLSAALTYRELGRIYKDKRVVSHMSQRLSFSWLSSVILKAA